MARNKVKVRERVDGGIKEKTGKKDFQMKARSKVKVILLAEDGMLDKEFRGSL